VSPDGQVTVPRFDIAVDCGTLINLDRVKAQMESAVIFGMGLTLYDDVTFKNGAVEQANLDSFRMPRADVAPDIHVHILPSNSPPTGVGDPGVPVIAPAICNAIFAAVGKRVRSLPIDPQLLKD
jgi:isoquinoline 1-oxidoreductase beta subunit